MSREILIGDLQAKGEEQIAALWRACRAEAEQFRAEAEQRRIGEHDRCDLTGRLAEQALQRSRIMAARRRAEAIVIQAEQELSARLYGLARELLAGEWPGAEVKLFARLAAELPAGDWSLIRVNPADFETAAALFPLARIESDPEIPGGLIATSGDGRVTIDNTWSTRLRRIWSRLAPKLLREVAQDAGAG